MFDSTFRLPSELWTLLPAAALALVLALSELALTLRRRAPTGESGTRDRATLLLIWAVIGGAVLAAMAVAARVPLWRWGVTPGLLRVAVALFVAGLLLRWIAILVLGRLFTVNVAIRPGHAIVTRGPYALVRHPSYTGLLVALLGLALAMGSGVALAVLMLPASLALARRIAIEERVMERAFGPEWQAYAGRTWRLVPGVY